MSEFLLINLKTGEEFSFEKEIMEPLKEYLRKWWHKNNLEKYYKYFDEWFENLTGDQIFYFEAQMYGDLSPYARKK